MLIVALVLAVIGLAALVTAVVTSNELIAWVCIGASVIGVLLLIVDALRDRSRDSDDARTDDAVDDGAAEDYPDDATTQIPTYTDGDSDADTSTVAHESHADVDDAPTELTPAVEDRTEVTPVVDEPATSDEPTTRDEAVKRD
ncbi:hypothetical protein MARA_05480 [Mycolicibacterium arabiense]|uniref:Transmembrane protein n=1 Tax=Mycolicibacterium arabiense TaxID=1286181 RepID=A0A7I7RSC3_9MYCO|nr:hypothetical protein [Mycolicibacterium arabiense]MCV7376231.1 hypothetical protein [Mycolicibacterium arabiense]BBY47080.1 hypothetical protein MARA_05480 [Mycolicibacterium arabiense]